MNEKSLSKVKERRLNDFIVCVCGIQYISGYTHCPKCGVKNPNDTKDINENSNAIDNTVLLQN